MRLPKKAFSLFLSKKYSRTKFLKKTFQFSRSSQNYLDNFNQIFFSITQTKSLF